MTLNEDNLKTLIANALYDNEIINTELYEKCSKQHITTLPYDLRTNDLVKLKERETEIKNRITEETENIKTLEKEEDNLRKQRKEYNDVQNELKESARYLDVLNRRYTAQYKGGFDKAHNLFLGNSNLHRFLDNIDANPKSSTNKSLIELHSRILANFAVLDNTLFHDGFITTPSQMSRLKRLHDDILDYTNMDYDDSHLIPYNQNIIKSRLEGMRNSAEELEKLTVIPKDFLETEAKIDKLSKDVEDNSEKLYKSIRDWNKTKKEIISAQNRVKDYENELKRLNPKLTN